LNRIGIRREDKNRWEARAPLLPSHVRSLAKERGVRIVVQPSTLRAFTDREYAANGARVGEDLSECEVILGVKEIPAHLLAAGKTYMFFSHTIKGQAHNMEMLRRLMALRCQLLDYERIRDEQGRRLIFFSRFAGLAGAIDSLWALGRRLQWEDLHPNPFAELRQTYAYSSLEAALEAVREAGERIATTGLPPAICPFVIGVTGYGNVAKGAQEVLAALGAAAVMPADVDGLFAGPVPTRLAHRVEFTEREMVAPASPSAAFDLSEYFAHPELYREDFERRLPRLALLINCIYWDSPYPRLVTKGAVRRLFDGGTPLLRVIADVSCDIEGSIEFTLKETSIDAPVYVYDPRRDSIADGVAGEGPVVLAVGNLPCELPQEASAAFGAALMPFMPALAVADFTAPLKQLVLPAELRRALILHHGEFTPEYEYLGRYV
jgi:alpha-aminoadipic semialdehyde synthase